MKSFFALPLAALLGASFAAPAGAAPVEYKIDPNHTFPSFEADHMNGVSVWRGKMTSTTGTLTLDRAAGTGTLAVKIDAGSIDFGQRQLNRWAIGPQLLDVAQFAQATYVGQLGGFVDGAPTTVTGELTLHGVTRPLALRINRVKCVPHPLFKRELCGADASGSFNRDEFGLDYGKEFGFRMEVTLRIQIEAVAVP